MKSFRLVFGVQEKSLYFKMLQKLKDEKQY